MSRNYFKEALSKFNIGKHQWYGWKKKDDNGNLIPNNQRMTYENIVLNDSTATLPSKSDVDAMIQTIKDEETEKANNKTSAQNKLKALGLTDAEIKALMGA